jgi:hypothetical protein
MFSNGVIRAGLLVGLCFVSRAEASPIEYTFSGTLAQPFNGSTQFSGTLAYDTALPPYPGIQSSPGWSYYAGMSPDPSSPIGNVTFNLPNTPFWSFGNIVNSEVIVAHTQGTDGFFIQEQFPFTGGENLTAEIGFSNNNLTQPGPFDSSKLPASLKLADFNQGANLTVWGTTADGQQINVVGTITSLVPPQPIPEPTTLLVFAVVGAGIIFRRRRARENETPR